MTCSPWPKDAAFEGLPDHQALELAASVVRQVKLMHYRRLRAAHPDHSQQPRTSRHSRTKGPRGRLHAGLSLSWTLDHSQFAQIVAGAESQLRRRPEQESWRDLTVAF